MSETTPYEAGCPFFKYHKSGFIYCEACRMKWPDKKSRETALRTLCKSDEGYKCCSFYKILDGYYERLYGIVEAPPNKPTEKIVIETPEEKKKERLLKEEQAQHEEYLKGLQKRIANSYRNKK